MSDTLHYEHYHKLMCGDAELHIGDRIEVLDGGEWRVGVVKFDRHWQSFYIELPGKTIWMWEGLPARPALHKPGTPAAK